MRTAIHLLLTYLLTYSADSLGWAFAMIKYKYIFEENIRKQFYQTALEKCYGLKLPKLLIAILKNKFIVLFIIIFGTLSFPILTIYGHKLGFYRHRPISASTVYVTVRCPSVCPVSRVQQRWAAGARLTKYLTTDLRLSYDDAKVTVDLRRTSKLPNILRRPQGMIYLQNRKIVYEIVFVN